MEHWYAVHTKPRKEAQVREFLEGRGFETYLPAAMVPNKRRPREKRAQPFFARYLFVHLDPAVIPLSSVNWAQGVTGIVSFGGEPAIVQDEVIAWLRRRVAEMDEIGFYGGPLPQPNERVRVIDGPLQGMDAIFDRRLSAEDRARVLIDLLGRLTACEVPLHWLERL
ncbi:MAG TPA: transcription termination/antitermination NusG family protein [Anaerolineae bacterium]|nr:transcription termination/antitermination NusG family protein [Anaerolineae bacterium]